MTQAGIYSLLDVKSKMYGPLITFISDEVAIRNIQEMFISGDKRSLFCMYPQDYILFCLGHYDNATGQLIPLPAPALVINGMEVASRALEDIERRRALTERLEGIHASSPAVNPHVNPELPKGKSGKSKQSVN
ncbi:nonstructural protein [Peromfec virus RodF8_40]|uniref:Nonstructural protein n=1 Tax=Peromfec virus RodF8_40 TaxID=2929374 RepID=A0A976N1T6_9VIRU|nr:nonstructural protein [Peromfec virus RodF8_40]